MLCYKFTLYLKSLSNVFVSTFQKEHTGIEKDKKMFTVAFHLFIRKDSKDSSTRWLKELATEKKTYLKTLKMER